MMQPVAFYATVFFLVDATCLIWELFDRTSVGDVSPMVRRIMRTSGRDFMFFRGATVVALKYPLAGLGICICCCLIVYLKPDPPAGRVI
jgi:hypothetical protein